MVRLPTGGDGEPDGDRPIAVKAPSHAPSDRRVRGETRQDPAIRIDCYTDPLCVWSWASEPQWRRLRYEFGDQISWTVRMGGMIPDWADFSDPLNDVGSPLQMGPHWYHVRQQTGMPLDERIWVDDPPASSYPASMAVKAAGLQGPAAGEGYLRRVREALLLERRNVDRREVLLEVGGELAEDPRFAGTWDAGRFAQDLGGPAAIAGFREDVQDARYREIGRFPTLIVRPRSGRAILLMGSHPYEVLRRAVAHLDPELAAVRPLGSIKSYVEFWGRVTAHEIAQAFELEPEQARGWLEGAVQDGTISSTGASGRELYAVGRDVNGN